MLSIISNCSSVKYFSELFFKKFKNVVILLIRFWYNSLDDINSRIFILKFDKYTNIFESFDNNSKLDAFKIEYNIFDNNIFIFM